MQALIVLAREHAAIAALLVRFESEIAAAVRSGGFDGEAVERLLRFFEREVDGHHQEKEERVLLPRLLARAHLAEFATLRTLAQEHTLQRELLARMRGQIEGASYGEPFSLALLVRQAGEYIQHEREHSRWEQRVLFPFARRTLGPADDRALVLGFRRLDELWGAPVWEAACSLAEWLDQRRSLVRA